MSTIRAIRYPDGSATIEQQARYQASSFIDLTPEEVNEVVAAFAPPAPRADEVTVVLRQPEAREWQHRLRQTDADEGLDATEVHLLAALNVALNAAAAHDREREP